MFKKLAFAGLGIALLASPLLVSADTLSDLQAQIASLLAQLKTLQEQVGVSTTSVGPSAPAGVAGNCVNLSTSVGPDDTDANTNGSVTSLQQFLGGRVTGYFGPATLLLVQQWQASHGLVSSGDPDSTGFGYVGPRTRAAMVQGCVSQPMPITDPIPSTPPISSCVSNCGTPSVNFNASPTSGQAPLHVNFQATDIMPGTAYSINFGDGSSVVALNTFGGGTSGVAGHDYTAPGTYTATLWQALPKGCEGEDQTLCSFEHLNTKVGTVTITVGGTTGGDGVNTAVTIVTPNGGETYRVGDTMAIRWNASTVPSNAQATVGIRDMRYGDVAAGSQVITTTSNTGMYSWTIPANLANAMFFGAGNVYKIWVDIPCNCSSANWEGRSINTFTITSGSQTTLRSHPTVALVPLPSSGLADGRLIRFSVTAAPTGSIGLGGLTFSANATPANVQLYGYTDASYSNPISGQGAGGNIQMQQLATNNGLTYYSVSAPTFPLEIAAGQTTYFELRANSTGLGNVTTTLLGDNQPMPLTSGLAALNGGMFIWSPNTSTTSSYQMSDWTNGYGISTLPVSQTRTAGGSGTLTVAPGQQPANGLAFQGAIIPFTRFVLTNTSSNSITITSLTVQRNGMAPDAAFNGVSAWSSDNMTKLGGAMINSNHQANLSTQLTLNAGLSKTVEIDGDMEQNLSAYAGQAATLSLVGIGTTAQVSGTLPIIGATHVMNASLDVCSNQKIYGYQCWFAGTPPVGFAASPSSGAAPLDVLLSAYNLLNSGTYSVSYGDGQQGTICNQDAGGVSACGSSWGGHHTYSSAGTYTATLVYQASPLCPAGLYCTQMMPAPQTVGTATITVTGSTQPPTITSITPSQGPVGTQVSISGSGFDPQWNTITVGTPSGGYAPSTVAGSSNGGTRISFALPQIGPGTYFVTVYNNTIPGNPASNSVSFTVTAVQPTLTATPASGPAPLLVNFTSNTGGPITFGDGTSGTLNLAPVCATCAVVATAGHTYTAAGNYFPGIPSTANCGGYCGSVVTANVTVTAAQTNPSLTATPTSGAAPLAVSFKIYGGGGTMLDYGDGSSVQLNTLPAFDCAINATSCPNQIANHTYASAGTYTAKLIQTFTCKTSPGFACDPLPPQTVGTAVITVNGSEGVGMPWTGTVSSSGTNANLANALSALESALKAILEKLGQ